MIGAGIGLACAAAAGPGPPQRSTPAAVVRAAREHDTRLITMQAR